MTAPPPVCQGLPIIYCDIHPHVCSLSSRFLSAYNASNQETIQMFYKINQIDQTQVGFSAMLEFDAP